MRPVQQAATRVGPVVGLLSALLLIAGLELTGELATPGLLTGAGSAAVGCVLLARGLARRDPTAGLSPADRVTLVRLVLGCGLAALTVTAVVGGTDRRATVVTLAGVALLTDWLDGRVARRTGSVTPLGARFDMETDAFLVLTLSVYVAPATGWWVVAIGLARYVFFACRVVWPWLRGTLPPRYWCKVVAAMQGIVLTAVATDWLPPAWEAAVLVVSMGFLAESFGREAWQLHALAAPASASPREPLVVAAPATREPRVHDPVTVIEPLVPDAAARLAVLTTRPEAGLADG